MALYTSTLLLLFFPLPFSEPILLSGPLYLDFHFVLQCFVGWALWPLKVVPEITCRVLDGTLNLDNLLTFKPVCFTEAEVLFVIIISFDMYGCVCVCVRACVRACSAFLINVDLFQLAWEMQ